MRTVIDKVFFEHPATVDESYSEHLIFAWSFGLELIGAGIAALTHALVPCLFERTASTTVKRLHAIIVNRTAASQPEMAPDPLAFI